MSGKFVRSLLGLILAMLVLATVRSASAGDGLTPEEVAAAEREFTYTTAEDVAKGRLAAERYWLYTYTLPEILAAEREFSYTTAEDVQKGKEAAARYWRTLMFRRFLQKLE